MFKILLRDL